jgi:hypothetical protein
VRHLFFWNANQPAKSSLRDGHVTTGAVAVSLSSASLVAISVLLLSLSSLLLPLTDVDDDVIGVARLYVYTDYNITSMHNVTCILTVVPGLCASTCTSTQHMQ